MLTMSNGSLESPMCNIWEHSFMVQNIAVRDPNLRLLAMKQACVVPTAQSMGKRRVAAGCGDKVQPVAKVTEIINAVAGLNVEDQHLAQYPDSTKYIVSFSFFFLKYILMRFKFPKMNQ